MGVDWGGVGGVVLMVVLVVDFGKGDGEGGRDGGGVR